MSNVKVKIQFSVFFVQIIKKLLTWFPWINSCGPSQPPISCWMDVPVPLISFPTAFASIPYASKLFTNVTSLLPARFSTWELLWAPWIQMVVSFFLKNSFPTFISMYGTFPRCTRCCAPSRIWTTSVFVIADVSFCTSVFTGNGSRRKCWKIVCSMSSNTKLLLPLLKSSPSFASPFELFEFQLWTK